MEPKMDPKSIAVNGRRSTASSKNIHRFRALFLQIFLRLTDPPIFKNIGFTIVKQRFSRSRLSEKMPIRSQKGTRITSNSTQHPVKTLLKLAPQRVQKASPKTKHQN